MDDFADNGSFDTVQASTEIDALEGSNRAPHLDWSDVPEGTKGFVHTCLDADAPTPTEFWHFCASNIPASVTSLPTGWTTEQIDGAQTDRNDAGQTEWLGCAPPAGDGTNCYIFAGHALDVDSLDLNENACPARVNAEASTHLLGCALLTGTYNIE